MINGKYAIAMCTSRIWDDQHHSYIQQLNEILKQHNCCLLIFALNSDLYWEENKKTPESYVFDIIPYKDIDCLILMDEKIKSRVVSERIIAKARENSCPVIVADAEYDGIPSVSFDYEKGFECVVRHAVEFHSAKHPHFIAGSEGNKFSDARLAIFRKVLEENGIPFNDSMVSYGQFWSTPAREAAQRLVDSGNIPDAVICANDIMAVNVSDVFVKAGIKVPEQVIVTGFDGIEEAFLSTPPLTTAGCDSGDLAEAMGKCVLDIIDGKPVHDVAVIPKLCPNKSCGCEYKPGSCDYRMDNFNTKFYRHEDDVRMLYNISTRMQMADSAEHASEQLHHYLMHDACVIVDRKCLENGRNYFADEITGDEMSVFFDHYDQDKCNVPLAEGELVPDIKARTATGFPLIFNALDYMSKPFGYICYSYVTYDANIYMRSSSISNTVSMGLGGFVGMHYQRFLMEKMTVELNAAAQMQTSMLPSDFESNDQYEIYASMIPAKNVGGDFYDFFHIDPKHLALVMADVSGKGVPAALLMAVAKSVIHDRALRPGTPSEILRDVNLEICENNKLGLFITIWFGIIDLDTGIVTYASAGHEYPAVKLGSSSFTLVKRDNLPPVGTSEDIEYEDLTIDMSEGGDLFIYTDGVTDVKNAAGEHFGVERMAKLLNSMRAPTARSVIKSMTAGIDEFSGGDERFDDTTMMCLRYKNGR